MLSDIIKFILKSAFGSLLFLSAWIMINYNSIVIEETMTIRELVSTTFWTWLIFVIIFLILNIGNYFIYKGITKKDKK